MRHSLRFRIIVNVIRWIFYAIERYITKLESGRYFWHSILIVLCKTSYYLDINLYPKHTKHDQWLASTWLINLLRFYGVIHLDKYCPCKGFLHDDVIKWKHFPRYWPFVRIIHRSPVNSPHKGQWRGVVIFSLICVWINGWINNREAGDLRRYCAHYDVIVMA